MKEQVKLARYETLGAPQRAVGSFVAYYNHHRYHQGLGNATPTDAYYGRREEILKPRKDGKECP